jgi:phage terminase small subunit
VRERGRIPRGPEPLQADWSGSLGVFASAATEAAHGACQADRKWHRLLAPLGVLTVVDGLGLELGALALAECWRHEAVIREKGATYETTTPAGSTMIRPRPEVALAADAWRRASSMLQQFGLTPVSRARVEARPPDAPDSKWLGLLTDPISAFRRQRPASPSPRRPA